MSFTLLRKILVPAGIALLLVSSAHAAAFISILTGGTSGVFAAF
jgi:hypothetical protein